MLYFNYNNFFLVELFKQIKHVRDVRITYLPVSSNHAASGNMQLDVHQSGVRRITTILTRPSLSINLFFRAVQWHYIDKLSNDTVPNHTFITTNHQALFIYNRTNIAG